MPAAVIQANYDDLQTIAGNFSQQAQSVEQLIQQMARLVQSLEGGGWTGLGAEAFFAEMGDLIFPAVHRLTGALNDANEVVGRISSVFRDAEEEASRQFEGNGSGETVGSAFAGASASGSASGFVGGLFGGAPSSGAPGALAQGTAADISKYQNGVNGWSTISMDGSKGFTPNELLAQTGPTCTLYGTLNLLVASGYDISQGGADSFVKIVSMQEAWWRPDMWLDDEPNWGFDTDVAEDIAGKFKANFKHGNFTQVTSSGGFFGSFDIGPNAAKAEQFLVNTVRGGQPVMVSMEADDSFGVGGAHVANVVGVQTGTDGKLTSVLIATNWAGQPVMEIPAATFMDDWLGYDDGEYMIVDRKAPPPPQPGAGFSKDLLDELNRQGFPNPTQPPPPSNAPRS